MAVIIFLAIAILPLLEIALIITVAMLIGIWPTLLLLIVGSLIGALLLKKEGRGAITRLKETIERGEIPARETADGGLIATGGFLLIQPGFISDFIGLGLLIPPTRAIVRQKVLKADLLHERLLIYRLPSKKPAYDFEGSAVEDNHELPEKSGH